MARVGERPRSTFDRRFAPNFGFSAGPEGWAAASPVPRTARAPPLGVDDEALSAVVRDVYAELAGDIRRALAPALLSLIHI